MNSKHSFAYLDSFEMDQFNIIKGYYEGRLLSEVDHAMSGRLE